MLNWVVARHFTLKWKTGVLNCSAGTSLVCHAAAACAALLERQDRRKQKRVHSAGNYCCRQTADWKIVIVFLGDEGKLSNKNNGKKSRHSLNGWGGSSSQVPLLTDRWFGESDLASSNKGYTGYREVLGGIGGPNQANLEA